MWARRVWRYEQGNQKPYIEEQTTQWPKEKVQNDKQIIVKKDKSWKHSSQQLHSMSILK